MLHAEAGRTEVVGELIVQKSPLDAQDQVTLTNTLKFMHTNIHITAPNVCTLMHTAYTHMHTLSHAQKHIHVYTYYTIVS